MFPLWVGVLNDMARRGGALPIQKLRSPWTLAPALVHSEDTLASSP